MAFRQDTDPGSVKSLLALLRSNQAQTSSPSPTPPPPNPFQNPPQAAPFVPPVSSLQDLLATLRRANESPQPGPSSGTGYLNREPEGQPSAKRRRVEPEIIDPYAEDLGQYEEGEEAEGEEVLESESSDFVGRSKGVREPSTGNSTQKPHSGDIEPPDELSREAGGGLDRDHEPIVEEEEEEEHDDRNRYGYTPEEMAGLSIDEGRTIINELLERQDVRTKLKQLKKEQEDLERHMWKKRTEIVEDYRKKLPAERASNHPDYQKVIKQRTSALLKFYAQRVLPFYDIMGKKQLVSLSELGFPCLGKKDKGDDEVDGDIGERRGTVLEMIEGKLKS